MDLFSQLWQAFVADLHGEDIPGVVVLVGVFCGVMCAVVGSAISDAREAVVQRQVRLPREVQRCPARSMPQTGHASAVAEVRWRAHEALAAARCDLARAAGPVEPEARESVEAATLLTRSDDIADLAGAVVFAEHAGALLTGRTPPVRCHYNPLHAAASGTGFCPDCRDAIVDRGTVDVLRAPHRGRLVPYYNRRDAYSSMHSYDPASAHFRRLVLGGDSAASARSARESLRTPIECTCSLMPARRGMRWLSLLVGFAAALLIWVALPHPPIDDWAPTVLAALSAAMLGALLAVTVYLGGLFALGLVRLALRRSFFPASPWTTCEQWWRATESATARTAARTP